MRYQNFRGVMPALTTPFKADLSLDIDDFARLVEVVIGDGVNGFIANGCTGESWSLTSDERFQLFRTAVEVSAGRVPVVAGCSAMSAAETVGKIRQAEKAGCSYAMVSAPWYIIPGPEEIMDHFLSVLDKAEIPLLLYNIPRRTGVHLTLDMIDRLADHPGVAGIKESSKDWGTLSSVIRLARSRISVFAGFAAFFGMAALCEGADGYMDSGSPVFGARSVDMYRHTVGGNIEEARAIQAEMAKVLDCFFGIGTFPAGVKASLDLVGRPGGGPTRPPIRTLGDEQRGRIRAAMVKAGFLA